MDLDASKLIQQSREVSELFDSINKLENKPKDEEFEPLPEPPKVTFLFGNNLWPVKEREMRKEILGFIEQFYNETSKLPQKKNFEEVFKRSELPPDDLAWQELFLSLQGPLHARGIPAYELPEYLLEPHFVLAVSLICDPLDKRAIQAKLKEAGLTTKQWKNFIRQEKYLDYYNKCVNEIFSKSTRTQAKLNLAKLVENGDLQAIKYFEERENIYRPQREVDLNQILVNMLTVMMEILGKHVKPDVLQKVAYEFQERNIIELPVGSKELTA